MVYLLCFNKKFKHAKHYIGFAESQATFERRLDHHKKGSGAKLMDAITKAGIGFTVTRTWPDGDRNFERKLKNRKKSSELCPHCIELKRRENVIKKEAQVIKEMNKPPVICPVVESYKVTHDKAYPPEVVNAQSQGPASPSRWRRIWNSLARFFTVQETDSLQKR